MYIIVVGGGRVGYYLTKALIDEGHEVLVVEKSATICEVVNDELGSVCLRGDGCGAGNRGLRYPGTLRTEDSKLGAEIRQRPPNAGDRAPEGRRRDYTATRGDLQPEEEVGAG